MASPQVIAGSGTAVHEHGDPGSRWPPFYLTMYTAARILSGESPGRPLKDRVAKISPTPLLLIATGGSLPVERDFNRIYQEAAREPVEFWGSSRGRPYRRHSPAARRVRATGCRFSRPRSPRRRSR